MQVHTQSRISFLIPDTKMEKKWMKSKTWRRRESGTCESEMSQGSVAPVVSSEDSTSWESEPRLCRPHFSCYAAIWFRSNASFLDEGSWHLLGREHLQPHSGLIACGEMGKIIMLPYFYLSVSTTGVAGIRGLRSVNTMMWWLIGSKSVVYGRSRIVSLLKRNPRAPTFCQPFGAKHHRYRC